MNKTTLKKMACVMGMVIAIIVIVQMAIIIFVMNIQSWASILCQNWAQLAMEMLMGMVSILVLVGAMVGFSYCKVHLSNLKY